MKWSNKKTIQVLVDIIIMLFLVALDQITKYLAIVNLKDQPAFVLMEDVFELHYLENRGAAFGMLQNQKVLFVIISIVMLFVIGYLIVKFPEQGFRELEITLVFISAGAVGNLIDRIRFDYVVDFFYFKLIDFPIFNMADIYVSVCCVVLILLLLFVYKEDDFDFLNKKKNQKFKIIKQEHDKCGVVTLQIRKQYNKNNFPD